MAVKEVKEKPLEKMTAKELRELALSLESIVGVHSMNKPELIEAIKDAKGIVDEGGRKVDTGAIRALKSKIVQLKAAREEARESGDKVAVDRLRRRISTAKKKTRRLASNA